MLEHSQPMLGGPFPDVNILSEDRQRDIRRFPQGLINAENNYKNNKAGNLQEDSEQAKVSPPAIGDTVAREAVEAKKDLPFFSSDPKKDQIMKDYWPLLKAGFESAVKKGSVSQQTLEAALGYLTVIIQRYYDLEKGHFDWRGSEITRFERQYLDENFGIVLPRWVAKDEDWQTFLGRIGESEGESSGVKIPLAGLKEHLKKPENQPRSMKNGLPDITITGVQIHSVATYPEELIRRENQYKNRKFAKLETQADEKFEPQFFSSKATKDDIMQKYWLFLKAQFEKAAKANDSTPNTFLEWVKVIISRYYEMQKEHFDWGGSRINKFERNFLAEHLHIHLPWWVGKTETWEQFVDKITSDRSDCDNARLRTYLKSMGVFQGHPPSTEPSTPSSTALNGHLPNGSGLDGTLDETARPPQTTPRGPRGSSSGGTS